MASPAIYNKPCLPSLLTEYGLDEKEQIKQAKARERKKVKKPKKKKSFGSDSEDDLEAQRARERDEHYEQMVRNLYKLRDYYYNEYSSLLADKVEKQRKQIKERDAIVQREKEKKEEEEKIASHQVKKRLERHTLQTTPVTSQVQKTDLYHIIGLEDKLRRQGKLKTVTDYNKFRQEMDDPSTFRSHFNVRKNNAPPSTLTSGASGTSSLLESSQGHGGSEVFSLPPDPNMGELDPASVEDRLRSLSRISETHETSRPTTRQNWAVTQQQPAQNRPGRRMSNATHGSTKKVDPQTELEKRFPKLEMPQLHCFTMNLSQKPPDPEEVQQQAALRAREKQRKRTLRTVTKMYQLAMANTATQARILAQHPETQAFMHGPDLCDVIADHHWMEAYGIREMPEDYPAEEQEYQGYDDNVEAQQPSNEQEHQLPAIETFNQDVQTNADNKLEVSQSPKSRASSRKSSAKSKRSLSTVESRMPQPLTMNEIEGGCNIKEAKKLSTLWSNYLRAGKNQWDS